MATSSDLYRLFLYNKLGLTQEEGARLSLDDLEMMYHAAPSGGGGGGLEGNGPPDGNVTAPLGTIYTDTLMTTGALLWVRTPAGWETHHADTGVRDIRPLVDDIEWRRNGGPATIRRAGNLVTLALDLYSRGSWALSDSSSPLTLPAGFIPENDVMAWVGIGGEDGEAWASMSRLTGEMTILTKGGFVLSDWTEFGLTLTYSTADEWPTTLPGTPV